MNARPITARCWRRQNDLPGSTRVTSVGHHGSHGKPCVQGMARACARVLRGTGGRQLQGLLARPQGRLRARRQGADGRLPRRAEQGVRRDETLPPLPRCPLQPGQVPVQDDDRRHGGRALHPALGRRPAGRRRLVPHGAPAAGALPRRRRGRRNGTQAPVTCRGLAQEGTGCARDGGAQDGTQGLPARPPAGGATALQGPGRDEVVAAGGVARHRGAKKRVVDVFHAAKPLLGWLDTNVGA